MRFAFIPASTLTMRAREQFDKNEGVTLMNILILIGIFNTSVAGHTVTFETISSYLISVKLAHFS